MHISSLNVLAVAEAMQADRLAEAERWRQANTARQSTDTRPSQTDLAQWLTLTGELVAGLEPDELHDRRQALQAVVDQLLASGRDAGLELPIVLDEADDPIVLARMLGWLAGRTAGTHIPVSWLRGRRLARAVRRLGAPSDSIPTAAQPAPPARPDDGRALLRRPRRARSPGTPRLSSYVVDRGAGVGEHGRRVRSLPPWSRLRWPWLS